MRALQSFSPRISGTRIDWGTCSGGGSPMLKPLLKPGTQTQAWAEAQVTRLFFCRVFLPHEFSVHHSTAGPWKSCSQQLFSQKTVIFLLGKYISWKTSICLKHTLYLNIQNIEISCSQNNRLIIKHILLRTWFLFPFNVRQWSSLFSLHTELHLNQTELRRTIVPLITSTKNNA